MKLAPPIIPIALAENVDDLEAPADALALDESPRTDAPSPLLDPAAEDSVEPDAADDFPVTTKSSSGTTQNVMDWIVLAVACVLLHVLLSELVETVSSLMFSKVETSDAVISKAVSALPSRLLSHV